MKMLATQSGEISNDTEKMTHNNRSHGFCSQSLNREAKRTNQQERKMIAHGKWRTSIAIVAYNPIYLLIFVTFISRLVYSLQLPQQQQSDLESSLQQQETKCLNCIRTVSSAGIDVSKRCEGYYCGPYQISYQYWAEAGKPGNSQGTRDYEKCARDKQCAESTVRAYFKKFKRDCNNDGLVDCLDMAALHKGGPQSCAQDWFYKSRYWQAFNKTTCATDRDPIAIALQKSSLDKKESSSQTRQTQVVTKNQTLTSECLDCICEALTSCSSSQSLSASNCGSGTVCGPFAISQSYWKDGRRPGASWTACARTKECSSVTIRNYMDKHKRDCNGDGFVTCEDYAAIHRRGPKSCMNRDLLKEHYWTRFLACRANQKPNNDANLVKVDDDDTQSSASILASRGVPTTSASTAQQTSSSPASSSVTTPSPSTFTPAAAAQTIATKLSTQVRPSSQQPVVNRYEYNPPGASTPTIGGNNPPIAYDPSPVLIETKQSITNSQVKTYQTSKPTTVSVMTTISPRQHQYDVDSQAHDRFILAHTHNVSPQELSYPESTSSSSFATSDYSTRPNTQTTRIYQVYSDVQHHQPQQSRPAIDYSSLPTIIVSKPLGSVSTNRVSQPPLSPQYLSSSTHDSDPRYSQTPVVVQTTVSMTTTTSPLSSLATSFATTSPSFSPGELEAAIAGHQPGTSGSDAPSINQQVPNLPASGQDDTVNTDYGASEFEHSGGHASFDRVVTDIVGNPNFSKAQPPVPQLVQQHKQPQGPQLSRGPSSSSTSISQSSLSTRIADQPSASTPSMASSTSSGNKRENSKTLSPNIYAVSGDSSSAHQADVAASILTGPEALNMTSLFDKGGLNETSRIPSECLDCICDASSNCDTTVQCISKQREKNRCGMYMISWNQYKESDISLTTLMSSPSSSNQNEDYDEKLYYECSTDRNCAEKLIHLYIEKYSKDCNHDGKIDCYDIAALHRVGPDSCNSHKFLGSQYWRDFNHCYATDRLTTTTTIQPQASSQGAS